MPSQLANILGAMSQLQKLVFVVPQHHSDLFGEAFRYAELVVPSVDVLVVGPHCEFMVAICPNVTIIYGKRQHSMNLMKAAGAASKLRHFEMTQSWEISSPEGIRFYLLLGLSPRIANIFSSPRKYAKHCQHWHEGRPSWDPIRSKNVAYY